MPQLPEKSLSHFALMLALIGLAGLYFFNSGSSYERKTAAEMAIVEDGKKVEFAGAIGGIGEGEKSVSAKVCETAGKCVSVSIPIGASADFAYYDGAQVSVFGEATSYRGAKFIRAEKIVLAGG